MERPVAFLVARTAAPDVGQILNDLSGQLAQTPPSGYARQLQPAFATLTQLISQLNGVGRAIEMSRVRLSDFVSTDRLPNDVPTLFSLYAPDWYGVTVGSVTLSQHLVLTELGSLTVGLVPYDLVSVAVDPGGRHISVYHRLTNDDGSQGACAIVPGFGFLEAGTDTPDIHTIMKAVTKVCRDLNTIPLSRNGVRHDHH